MGIYHPPPGSNFTNAIIIHAITEFLLNGITKYNSMVILGALTSISMTYPTQIQTCLMSPYRFLV